MNIRNKPERDPAVDLVMPDAYMRWALLAAEEIVGKQGLAIVLRQAGLEHLIDNYPPNEMTLTHQLPTQLKLGLENMKGGFCKIWETVGQTVSLRLEDRGDKVAYIAETCPMCAGKQADGLMCLSFTGSLQEGTHWLTGKEFDIQEVECRASGVPACVWEINKQPKAQE